MAVKVPSSLIPNHSGIYCRRVMLDGLPRCDLEGNNSRREVFTSGPSYHVPPRALQEGVRG